MSQNYQVWTKADLAQKYLSGVRSAIPLATEQIEIILRIIQATIPQVNNFLDLGCGDGILGQAILSQYPNSQGVFLDFSETMIEAAKSKIADNYQGNLEFINQDYGLPEWVSKIQEKAPFDVVVSGFSIHHQPDIRKQEIYQEIYQLLKPGGLFLNLEHVASPSKLIEQLFDELFVDSLYAFHQSQGNKNQSREKINQQYYNRPDKEANILAPVETQCDWLRKIGFIHVDCFMKLFELALFGGIKPEV
ncbi:MAG: methyltransferase domain-containing protein [Okeania sp. SIO3B5]|uniref:class I SAM-dependent methyltransferase n=1 Tax=Okeania sp. SIO3B5 TaxID=2607811 RepID=UPI0013FF339A|nr:methyltransferase domain-containing protein [Okeania sp. SIO3B5]NEO55025.1 methyltransferase domain-containing protein [Okeania sp. SIO3B5]